jgi:hypothetical protein
MNIPPIEMSVAIPPTVSDGAFHVNTTGMAIAAR